MAELMQLIEWAFSGFWRWLGFTVWLLIAARAIGSAFRFVRIDRRSVNGGGSSWNKVFGKKGDESDG